MPTVPKGPQRRLCAGSEREGDEEEREQRSEGRRGFPATQTTWAFIGSEMEGDPNTVRAHENILIYNNIIYIKQTHCGTYGKQ